MPTERTPTKNPGDESAAPPAPVPEQTPKPTTGTIPKTTTTGATTTTNPVGDIPTTPSKGVTKASKVELLDTIGKLRVYLGKATDAQTRTRYEALTKEKLVEEYYRLRGIAESGQAQATPKPASATPAPTPASIADITQLLLHFEQQRQEDL